MTRFANNFKTAILLGGLMGLFLLVGSAWGPRGMTIALIFGGLTNVIAFFFSDRIALASMRAQEVGPETPGAGGHLYRMVDELRQRAGMPMPKVCICPHEAPNAFATGRSPSKAAVAVTEGAMRLLNEEEMRGVIGHELAHIKNRDTLISCIAATVAGVLAYLAQLAFWFGGSGRQGGNPIVFLIAAILAPIGAVLIKAMISRSREYVADHDGAVIAGSPNGLISALQKLEVYAARIPMNNPNPAQNNLFIVEPFAGQSITRLFATHPPTENRIVSLRRMGAQAVSGGV
ncbi:MAG: zinc metalloprotease HtpX [Phycisphaeraceae bacterium]|nr:zinc metalloprotease HtpX [Phycisphaeraceae bacterium]